MPPVASRVLPEHGQERVLVEAAAAGDPAAFEVLMRRHNRMMYRAARSILKSDSEAEDAVQEAYVQAYRGLHGFRGQASLSTWLTRIAVNEALQRLRARQRERGVTPLHESIDVDGGMAVDLSLHALPESPEDAAVRAQLRGLLERKIDQLPAAFRSVFVLRAVEELSVEETALVLGTPEATVRTRFFRARALLRVLLERDIEFSIEDAFAFDGVRCDRIVGIVLSRLFPLDGPGPPGISR